MINRQGALMIAQEANATLGSKRDKIASPWETQPTKPGVFGNLFMFLEAKYEVFDESYFDKNSD